MIGFSIQIITKHDEQCYCMPSKSMLKLFFLILLLKEFIAGAGLAWW